VLGLVIAIGAFAIDMYIPGFAAIARDLKTDPGTVQQSMTSYFLALAVGQVIYGPISDTVGRRLPLFCGLGLFVLASIGAALCQSIELLIVARFVQGLGAAATAVIPLAIIRDEHTGPAAARLLSLAILALSISPVLAPVFGGFLAEYFSWRLIFVVLIAICLAVVALILVALPETLPPRRRVSAHPRAIASTYLMLLGSRRFMAPIMAAAFAQAVLFVFISASPFVFVTLHRVSPTFYGMLFALHAMSLIGITQFNAPMMRYFGAWRLIGIGAVVLSLAGLVLIGLVASGMTLLWPLVALTITMFLAMGLVMAPSFLTAMEPFGEVAGAAAAIGAGFEFCCSSVTVFIMGLCADGSARPMTGFMAFSACMALIGWLLIPRDSVQEVAA
jgi:DHA1 family bicyclomycin/chloramphenicol resistance-like MFS transporter